MNQKGVLNRLMNMKKDVKILFLLVFCLGFHTGVIRKEYNPIVDTQTDPITLKKKMEELKDGQKGAPTPSFHFYDKSEDFQVKTAIEEDSEVTGSVSEGIPALGDPLPENLQGEEGDWWAEDWSEDEKAQEQQDFWQESW